MTRPELTNDHKLLLKLPTAMWEKLNALAEEKQMSLSWMIREALWVQYKDALVGLMNENA